MEARYYLTEPASGLKFIGTMLLDRGHQLSKEDAEDLANLLLVLGDYLRLAEEALEIQS